MAPSARLLDLTRLVSRQGYGALTGIDRVELAYLERLLAEAEPLFGLVQTSVGFLLLDRAGCAVLHDLVSGRIVAPAADLFSRLVRRRHPLRARAEALLRLHAVARCLPRRLAAMLARALPPGTHYLNVGHANLSDASLRALRQVPGLRINIMVHDVIPLLHPEFARPGTVAGFAARMAAVAAHADLVIHTAEATRRDTEAVLAGHGRLPDGLVAPLGVEPPRPRALTEGERPARPWFVVLGTIEPRKNHALLLDLWEQHSPAADLLVIGGRGWAPAPLLARLDRGIPGVREVSGADDATVAAYIAGARALLFPSLAEGYGLPAQEARALGCPVICSDLPVFREILGNKAVYLDPAALYSWLETVNGAILRSSLLETSLEGREGLGWDGHFNRVLTVV